MCLMKRYTDGEKQSILNELSSSGLARAVFCRERGLCYASVGAWKKAAAHKAPARSAFVEVDFSQSVPAARVEVWLPGSVCVRFEAGAQMATLVDFCQRVSRC